MSATSELEELCPPEVELGSLELSTLDEELVVDSTELPLVSQTDCSPHPTSKTAARAAITIIFCEYSIFYHVLRGLSSGA